MGPLREAMKCALQGGLQANAIKDVIAIYGTAFRSRVFTWFHIARALNAEKRAIIAKIPDFNQAWVFGNKFLLGEGVEEKFVLNTASFELAVNLALWDSSPHLVASIWVSLSCLFGALVASIWVSLSCPFGIDIS